MLLSILPGASDTSDVRIHAVGSSTVTTVLVALKWSRQLLTTLVHAQSLDSEGCSIMHRHST